MLGAKVLDAANYPVVRLQSRQVAGELPDLDLLVDVEVRGRTTRLAVPVRAIILPEEIRVAGRLTVRQTDLGLEPFTAILGALYVRDALDMKFELVARPVGE
jgi:hypothetical protein